MEQRRIGHVIDIVVVFPSGLISLPLRHLPLKTPHLLVFPNDPRACRWRPWTNASISSRSSVEYVSKAANVALELRLVPRQLQARTDPALMERALRNLIENARRYTPIWSLSSSERCE